MMQTESLEKRQPDKALVTGGGGFLGRAIVRRLIARGDNVCSLARSFYPQLEKMGANQIQGDIADSETVAGACRNRTIVYHVAAKPPPWGRYADYYQTNVTGTQNVIAACRKHSIARLVYTSTPSVVHNGRDIEGADESMPYPEKFTSHYAKTKALAEQRVVKASGDKLKTIILRPHKIWGPGDNQILTRLVARAKKLKRIVDGKNLIDVTYIDDAAGAHILAADKLQHNPDLSGNIYFISQGEPVSAWFMVNEFLKAAGCGPVTKSVPYRVAWVAGALSELVYAIFRLSQEPYITRFLAQSVSQSNWFKIDAAVKDLGYAPQVTTREGLRRLAEWLKKERGLINE